MRSSFDALRRSLHRLPDWLWLSVAAAFAVGGYITLSAGRYGIGFPLDDAWIHQTYARNLAQLSEWSFIPGRPSAGSTSPLWSVLLAVGYLVRLAPLIWSFLLGGVLLAALATLMVRYSRASGGAAHIPALWIGLLVVFEYHLTWAAASGMETLLSALINSAVILMIASWRTNWLTIGVLVGLGLWVRPDSLTLLGPALVWLLWQRGARFWGAAARLAAGLGLLLIPYLLLNLYLDGNWWPNTYYAKQAEYAVLLTEPLHSRLARLFSLPLIGVGVMLLPGFVAYIVRAIKARQVAVLLGLVWWAGYLGLYALRLPVVYQHGRYIMPAMPLFFLWGCLGTDLLLGMLKGHRAGNLLAFGIKSATGLVLAGFYLLGGQAYARDVGYIESQMVATARWVAQQTGPGELIAAHDIGALGYFSERELLDLAGLVSPEVIAFMRDEAALSQHISEAGATYLVTLRTWYARLPACGELVYRGDAATARELGGDEMVVYRWLAGCRLD